MEFEDLLINARILDAIKKEGYIAPTPIQERAIPPATAGRDVLGCAQTGTGKTAAFAIPILHRLSLADEMADKADKADKAATESKAQNHGESPKRWAQAKTENPHIRALILSPTRELSMQIYESFCTYGKYLKLRCGLIIGGVSQHLQMKSLERGVDILVATPGRLLDLQAQNFVDLSHIQIFVLDEADKMLDMGFIHDVKRILPLIPKKRQTLFFTATMPPEVLALTKTMLHDPVSVSVSPESPVIDATEQRLYFTDKSSKIDLLSWILTNDNTLRSALIFTRTKHGADKLSDKLRKKGINSMAIHGDKSQGARQNALNSLKSGKITTLVATDIAARGIDIEDLSHVINFELPNVPEVYVHRIGRTGRAGKTGVAVSLCDFDEKEYLAVIEKQIKRKIPVVDDHPYPMTVFTKSPPKEKQPHRQNNNRRRG